jgi:hypothetical protein
MAMRDASAYTQSNGAIDINAVVADMVQRSPWIYYSTWAAAAAVGPASFELFSDTIATATKKKCDTNMVRSQQFPTSRGLVMDYLGIFLGPQMITTDIQLLLDNYYIEFRIDEKIQLEGPLQTFPSGFGLAGFSNITPAATDKAVTNGQPGWDHTRRMGDYCMYIAPLQNFSLTLLSAPTPPTFTSATRVQFYLGGLTDRSVQ